MVKSGLPCQQVSLRENESVEVAQDRTGCVHFPTGSLELLTDLTEHGHTATVA
ncbi:hypothetical protein RIEGSTA812A_PEG_167 [invertebrate metagenome]|uniref:Uncharacterized protein n=1 Tax=invertebrate metagenome TaxID=1711999 RepID=A0A484H5F8_9ZZZZ